MRTLVYGKRWFHTIESIREADVITPEEAQRRLKRNKLIVVESLVDGNPEWYIEIVNGVFGVQFVDPDRRKPLHYSFNEHDSGKVFMSQITRRSYDAVSGEPYRVVLSLSHPDGRCFTTTIDKRTGENSTLETGVDVSNHWLPSPEFGHYEQITTESW